MKCFKCLGFGHIALHCPLKQTLMIKKVKQDLPQPPTTSDNEKDKEGQFDMGLILSYPRCFPSLSFSLPKFPTYTPYWIKNVKDDFFIPYIFPNKIISKQYFPTWSVYRTCFYELPKFQSDKSCLPISSSILLSNCKLTLFYAGVLNSWTNSLQLGECDENKKDFINRRNGQGPKHLKFFLLVFAKDETQAQSPIPRKPTP